MQYERAVTNETDSETSKDTSYSGSESSEKLKDTAPPNVVSMATLSPPRLHQPRGRGRPSKAELLERERDRQDQIEKMFEEKGELYSLALVAINNKLAVQNALRLQLKELKKS